MTVNSDSGTGSFVRATLNYFTPPKDGSAPWSNIHASPETGLKERNYEEKAYEVEIENVRGKEDQYTLDTAGFEFHRVPTVMEASAFEDEEKIRRVYYREQEEVVKKVTGASKVVLYDHTMRKTQPGVKLETLANRHPVNYVHVDQSTPSSIARVRRHIESEEEAEKLLQKRFQLINLWRPIRVKAYDRPLTLCDYRSVSESRGEGERDLVPTKLINPDGRVGELCNVLWREGHRWKYLRGMDPEEFVLIKCFDSVQDGSVAVFTPHTSFEDPTKPEESELRESIELTALVFYE